MTSSANGRPTVGEVLEARGLTRDELYAVVTAGGSRMTRANFDKMSRGKTIPKSWAAALGYDAELPLDGDASGSGGTGGADPSGRAGERPPIEPEGARQQPVPAALRGLAVERIASTYGFLGGLGGMLSGNEAVPKVVDAYSSPIAEAWLRAAEENEFAARVVKLMTAGGATGELVTMHLILVGGLLYVTGRAPAFEGLYGARFGPPPVVPAARPERAPSADEAAADAVGDAAGAAAA